MHVEHAIQRYSDGKLANSLNDFYRDIYDIPLYFGKRQ